MNSVFFIHCNYLKVVTYKNNALDHFLEECLDSSPQASIVRVGGASSSERLKENLLAKVRTFGLCDFLRVFFYIR